MIILPKRFYCPVMYAVVDGQVKIYLKDLKIFQEEKCFASFILSLMSGLQLGFMIVCSEVVSCEYHILAIAGYKDLKQDNWMVLVNTVALNIRLLFKY